MTALLVVLGGIGTIGGSGVLVLAFRRGQAGDADGERRLFRLAVGGLAAGSVLFLLATASAPR